MILGLLYSIVRSLLDLLVLCRKTEAASRSRFWRSATSSAFSNARSIGRASGRPTACSSAPSAACGVRPGGPSWSAPTRCCAGTGGRPRGGRRAYNAHCCRCSHGTVRNVLRQHGLLPAPRRGQGSWREFVRQHAEQILAVDFFTLEMVWLQRLAASPSPSAEAVTVADTVADAEIRPALDPQTSHGPVVNHISWRPAWCDDDQRGVDAMAPSRLRDSACRSKGMTIVFVNNEEGGNPHTRYHDDQHHGSAITRPASASRETA